jgi:hypothetical protein
MTDDPKPMKRKAPLGRLYSKDPADAAWRRRQMEIDNDIEGLSRDPEIDRLFDETEASGVPIREQIKRLKASFRARQKALTVCGRRARKPNFKPPTPSSRANEAIKTLAHGAVRVRALPDGPGAALVDG